MHRFSLKNRNGWAFILSLWLASSSVFATSVPTESFQQLNESRALDAPVALHLTSEDNPLGEGVEVSLNHEDAWLFFDNIKPSVVADNYLQKVKVNGQSFNDGSNGRLAIYAHGTVLMPHASNYKPLTVYSGENFEGESESYGLHTFHNSLGDFDNTIKSFRLKRGYQVTFATKSDGQGYSRVFIADKEDLEFSVMPQYLDATISFIRVFKHQWVTKKGWAGWNWDEYQMVNATWYYDWNVGGSTTQNLEYVPIKQKSDWPGWGDINNKSHVSQLLGFNEPDRPDQANMSFDAALAMWPQFMSSGFRLGSPATSDPFNNWSLFNFIDRCDELNYRVDFVAIHAYWGGKSAQQWYNDLKYIHERTGRPIWITEWNNGANWTNEWWPDDPTQYTEANAQKQLNDLMGILTVLDTASFVERYSIYNWVEDARAMVLNGELTLAGAYYADNKSQIAYNSKNDVIPGYTYKAPVLSQRYLTLSNSIRLSWTDGNGDLSRSYKLEKKVDDGPFVELYASDDLSVLNYLDPLDPEASGAVRYRLGTETSDGTFLFSNEVSYYQTGGLTEVQAGVYPVNSFDWVQTIFGKKFDAAPKVILGMPTFNNAQPFTNRVNSINTNSLVFRLYPWQYLTNPQLTKNEQLPLLALPAGNYNFGGLKAQVGEVSGVTKDWVRVEFEQSFTEAPVVFATQVSNGNAYPTTVALDNVTSTGFDLSLKSEQGITFAALGERINYLAIEAGSGAIANFRVTVGQTGEDNAIAGESLEVSFDESYQHPAFFGSVLTDANAFASVPRYYANGDGNIALFRQREMSGGLSAIKRDQIGWMIMDLSADQPVSLPKVGGKIGFSLYPNPVKSVLHFEHTGMIQIIDLSGQQVFDGWVQQSLDVGFLAPGLYFLKAGNKVERFIKH